MKKNFFLLMAACLLTLGFSSCSDDNSQWRDDNLAFMDRIKNREGIHEIGDSINGFPGLYYEVLVESTSDTIPVMNNVVNVSYTGYLFNDTVNYSAKKVLPENDIFDTDESYNLIVGKDVIEGWSLILQHIPVGAKWRVYIPYYLAYGSTATTKIPAYSTLIFDIQLRKIVSKN